MIQHWHIWYSNLPSTIKIKLVNNFKVCFHLIFLLVDATLNKTKGGCKDSCKWLHKGISTRSGLTQYIPQCQIDAYGSASDNKLVCLHITGQW